MTEPVLRMSRVQQPYPLKSAPAPSSLAAVLLVALLSPFSLCHTPPDEKAGEAVPLLESWLPEPRATQGARSLGPAAATDIRLRQKHIFF